MLVSSNKLANEVYTALVSALGDDLSDAMRAGVYVLPDGYGRSWVVTPKPYGDEASEPLGGVLYGHPGDLMATIVSPSWRAEVQARARKAHAKLNPPQPKPLPAWMLSWMRA